MGPHSVGHSLLVAVLLVRAVGGAWSPPLFVVDLDAAPAERWSGAVDLVVRAHGWDSSFGAAFAAHNASLFEHMDAEHFATLAAALRRDFPEQAAELGGVVADMKEHDGVCVLAAAPIARNPTIAVQL